MKCLKFMAFFTAVNAVMSGVALAEIPMNIKGFGSAGALTTTEDLGLVEYGNKGKKVNPFDFFQLGLNASSEFSKSLRIQGQFSTEYDGYNYEPVFDWGFVSWQASSNLSVRFGRIILPIWLYSQQIDVGYSYNWTTLPEEVYGLNPLKSANGMSLMWKSNLGPGYLNVELYNAAGNARFKGKTAGQESLSIIELSDIWGATLSYSMFDDAVVLNGSYTTALMDAETEIEVATLHPDQTTYPNTSILTHITSPAGIPNGTFWSVGARADINDFVFASEFANRSLGGTTITEAKAFYLSSGYRMGEFLPLVTYSRRFGLEGTAWLHQDSTLLFEDMMTLNYNMQTSGSTLALGLNYSISDSAVLKAEVSNVKWNFEVESTNLNFWVFELKSDFVF